MYNFRYHLVTIVSIFAALAIGLLLGVALTGSDLVRDASSNLAQSLTEEFDELNQENRQLSAQLETESQLAEKLREDWQTERLAGRTIVILTRESAVDSEMVTTLSTLVTRSGGLPVIIQIAPEKGIDLENEENLAGLEKIVPRVVDEDYSSTLAAKLVREWSFTSAESDMTLPVSFDENYALTRYLVSSKQLTVTVDYQPLIDIGKRTGTYSALVIAPQLSAYSRAQAQGLPYGANGIIDLASHTPTEGGRGQLDAFGLELAAQFDSAGVAGDLPYLRLTPRQTGPSNEVTSTVEEDEAQAAIGNVNYYAVLVQSEEFLDLLTTASQDKNIPCEFSPLSSTGRYSVIALLTGAEKGSYGQNRNGSVSFPPTPRDRSGNAAFDKVSAAVTSATPFASETQTDVQTDVETGL